MTQTQIYRWWVAKYCRSWAEEDSGNSSSMPWWGSGWWWWWWSATGWNWIKLDRDTSFMASGSRTWVTIVNRLVGGGGVSLGFSTVLRLLCCTNPSSSRTRLRAPAFRYIHAEIPATSRVVHKSKAESKIKVTEVWSFSVSSLDDDTGVRIPQPVYKSTSDNVGSKSEAKSSKPKFIRARRILVHWTFARA